VAGFKPLVDIKESKYEYVSEIYRRVFQKKSFSFLHLLSRKELDVLLR
jgi:hypothetical protein